MGYVFHTLSHPYAAPSVLHIAVLLSIGPALELLATLQLEAQITERVFAQEIAGSHMSYPAPVLRHKWRQFLLAVHAEAKHASGRACVQPDRDRRRLRARLLRRLWEEGGLCLCWPRALRSTSTDLTFSRPCSPTNSTDTQGEGK